MSDRAIAASFLSFADRRLGLSGDDIARCVAELGEEQMARRSGEHENSITNLLLHLAGNMRQWILHGIDGQPDVRERDAEFSLSPETPGASALVSFRAVLEESRAVIRGLPPERLLEVINPQPGSPWENLPILQALFQVVGHVQLHAGQIIVLTKQMVARDLNLSMPRKR